MRRDVLVSLRRGVYRVALIDVITLTKRTGVVRVDLKVNAGTSLKCDVMAGPAICKVISAQFLC
jgi:hypothetical protein